MLAETKLSDPIKALEDQIAKLWKELTATQAVQPLPYLVNMLLPAPTGSQITPKNQRLSAGLENGVKAVINLGVLNADGTITNLGLQSAAAATGSASGLPAILQDVTNDDPSNLNSGITIGALGARRALDTVAMIVALQAGSTTVAAIPKLDNSQRLSNHPYDRNMTMVTKSYEADGVAVSGVFTDRWSYTIPASRLARFVGGQCLAVRATATTGVTYAVARILVGGVPMVTSLLQQQGVGTNVNSVISLSGEIPAGTIIKAQTADFNADGTMNFRINGIIEEFDA